MTVLIRHVRWAFRLTGEVIGAFMLHSPPCLGRSRDRWAEDPLASPDRPVTGW